MVLFLFVLMLLNLNKQAEPQTSLFSKLIGVLAAGALFSVLLAALKDSLVLGKNYVPGNPNIGTVESLGNLLFSKYVVPFEVSSILFIAAMVGAVLLAKREKQIID